MEYKSKRTTRPQTRLWERRERMKHNAMERKRRLIIKKQVNKLEECLPNVDQVKGQRQSRISILKRAATYIKETREANTKILGENSLLADENTALEKQITELIRRQQTSEASTETKEI